jgi:hypothetical protein
VAKAIAAIDPANLHNPPCSPALAAQVRWAPRGIEGGVLLLCVGRWVGWGWG